MNVIETNRLTKFYGAHAGIRDLDLEIHPGEVFGLLGPNGAGKTTTIRLLMGFLVPSAGTASILGKDIGQESVQIRREVGYVPGDVRLYGALTGQEAADFFARMRGGIAAAQGQLDALRQRFPVPLERRVKEYSQGMRQQLAIILAFMHDPRLLILDEPTLGLDPLLQQAFYQLLAETRERGKTVFISSHILPEMERSCDRVGIVRAGKLVAVEEIEGLALMKIRMARFRLEAGAAAPAELDGSRVQRVGEDEYEAELRGPIDGFVKALARLPLADLEIAHASLEELFLEYYRDEAGERR
ncbi:MAG: ABC transporter ATP-binding protein [Candidatus Geothermincolia bacterium]